MFAGCYVPFTTLPLVWCRLAHFLDLGLVERIKFTTHNNIGGDDNYQCVINCVQTTCQQRVRRERNKLTIKKIAFIMTGVIGK